MMSLFRTTSNIARQVTRVALSNNRIISAGFHKGSRLLSAKVGELAPPFKGTCVTHGDFKEITLDGLLQTHEYVVLMFYPLDFTFVCPTEIIAFSDRENEFQAINTAIVACSTDSHFSHLAWTNTPRKTGGLGECKIPLLADFNKTIASDYNVLIEGAGIALRGLFIIKKDGTLRHTSVNDLPVGRSVDETLRLVKAFQFHDKHGEVCPANWTPGAPTIKPDTQNSKEYFESVNKD